MALGEVWVSGNVFIRTNVLSNIGDQVDGHKHNFDHTTIVFKGAVRVTTREPDGRSKQQEFVAPAHFLVEKDVEHLIIATQSDTVFWCVYSHRTPDGEVTEKNTGWYPAYLGKGG